jgi:hypothetical protein
MQVEIQSLATLAAAVVEVQEQLDFLLLVEMALRVVLVLGLLFQALELITPEVVVVDRMLGEPPQVLAV